MPLAKMDLALNGRRAKTKKSMLRASSVLLYVVRRTVVQYIVVSSHPVTQIRYWDHVSSFSHVID